MGRLKRESLNGLLGLGRRLRELREAAGLSQMRVAELMGFNPTHGYKYILKLEKGTVPNPTLRTIVSFIEVCGADWPDLVAALPHAGLKSGARADGMTRQDRHAKGITSLGDERQAEGMNRQDRQAEGMTSLGEERQAEGELSSSPHRPLRVRLREERIAERERRAQALWAAVGRAEQAAAQLLGAPGRVRDRRRDYLAFIRLCCISLQAVSSSRPRAIENELNRLLAPALASGLERAVLEELVRLCRDALAPAGT